MFMSIQKANTVSKTPATALEREKYIPKFLWELNRGDLSTQQKFIVREELFVNNDLTCFVCPVPIKRDQLHLAVDIDHLVPKGELGRNFLPLMRLAHHNCNARRGKPKPSSDQKRERENGLGEWTSEEGRRSDKMTYRYRQRVYHPETGILRNPGQIFPRKWLADILPDECKIGHSTTYYKYIDEDIAAGYLDQYEIDGETKIERTQKEYPPWKLE